MIAALWAAFLWTGAALAEADVCRGQFGQPAPEYEWSIWLRDLDSRNGVASRNLRRRSMTDAERLRFLSAYNATPPVTDRNPERIELFWLDGGYQYVVVFVENGCVTVTARLFRQLVDSIIGIAAPQWNGGVREHDI